MGDARPALRRRVDFATGRGYDRKEYAPFGADFMASAEIFEEGIDVLLKAWNSPGKWSHTRQLLRHPRDVRSRRRPVQKPLPFYVASFSKTSVDIAAKRGLNIIYAPFAAGMVFGGLDKAVETYREACVKAGKKPGRAMCSYFIYIADDAKQEDYGRQTQMDYFNHCVLQAFPQKKEDAPPTMQYFMKIVDILKNMKKEDLSDKSILLGSPQKIVETLKRVEKARHRRGDPLLQRRQQAARPGEGADAPLHGGDRAALPGQAHRTDESRRLMWKKSPPGRSAEHDARDFRTALGCFPTGVCLITTLAPEGTPRGHDRQFVQLGVARAADGALEPLAHRVERAGVSRRRVLRDQRASRARRGPLQSILRNVAPTSSPPSRIAFSRRPGRRASPAGSGREL